MEDQSSRRSQLYEDAPVHLYSVESTPLTTALETVKRETIVLFCLKKKHIWLGRSKVTLFSLAAFIIKLDLGWS